MYKLESSKYEWNNSAASVNFDISHLIGISCWKSLFCFHKLLTEIFLLLSPIFLYLL